MEMTITSITTEAENEAALLRIEAIMDAERGTPEFEELQRLTALVMAFEEVAYPLEELPSAKESFRQGWKEVMEGKTLPVSELWKALRD